MSGNLGEFVAISIVTITGAVVVLRLTFALAHRLEAKSKAPQLPTDLTARLERIEQGIDSMAIEVERISEGQRFTTKMLGERSGNAPERR